jgi:hypothetical protein
MYACIYIPSLAFLLSSIFLPWTSFFGLFFFIGHIILVTVALVAAAGMIKEGLPIWVISPPLAHRWSHFCVLHPHRRQAKTVNYPFSKSTLFYSK